MFSVKDMAMNIIKIMSGHTQSKDLEVSLNVGSSLVVCSDQDRIEQVLMNLLSNAILCSPCGGKIKVSFSMEPYNLKQDMAASEYESLLLPNKNKLN